MKLLLLSPYHTGSHRAWAEGYARYSQHEVRPLTLPGHFWKWRLQGGAVSLARQFWEQEFVPDGVLATSLLDVATWLGLVRGRVPAHVPISLYMHENQLTYPLPEDGTTGPMRRQMGERDRHYALINYKSMLAADQVFFNSHYHQESFFAALPNLLKHFPDFNELENIPLLQSKSQVLPVGIDLQRLNLTANHQPLTASGQPPAAPLILWNQRWEYDKNPAAFFRALLALADEGVEFRVALCGENFRQRPQEFTEAIDRLGSRVIHAGYADEALYRELLWAANITLSTAHHEFFGISILEAIYCHTFPILPNRLSYPELIPVSYHGYCLYKGEGHLLEKLRWGLTQPDKARQIGSELAGVAAAYDWSRLAPQYDHLIIKVT